MNRLLYCFLFFQFYYLTAQAQSQYTFHIKNAPKTASHLRLKMGTNTNPQGEVLDYNDKYLLLNGKPWYPIMGEMHYSRCKEQEWEREILAMKAGGIQVISTYVIWIHHEMNEGSFDWKGNRNLSKFLGLCQKHGMYVWLRPGPWVHAEVKNGGFPDWLVQKKIKLRTNDSAYLHYAKIFIDQVAKQCEGYYFKQGGPIIGIQVENELQYKNNPAAYQHMKTLKQIMVQAGMDVPYYSAFAPGPDDQDEFLFMIGSYPDSPWSTSTQEFIKPVYFIKPLQSDPDIGSDLFGKIDVKVKNIYPLLSAEIGGGMQVTYHRRVLVSAADVAANVFVKIASGLNGLGYYMYHGGMNPVDFEHNKSLQESRLTGYPNDVPLVNYDFQSPLGAMDIPSPSYNELKLLHLFLHDYGSMLAEQKPYFPERKKESVLSKDTVQCSIRVKDGAGFIFLSNYQRLVSLPPVPNFQLQVSNGNTTEQIPRKPITFPSNCYIMWPFNLDMDGVKLKYATVQPLCILHNEQANTYIFFSDSIAPKMLFDNTTFQSIKTIQGCSWNKEESSIDGTKKKEFYFTINKKDGKQINILVLSRAQALLANKIKIAENKESLALFDGILRQNNESLDFETTNKDGKALIQFFPKINFNKTSGTFTCRQIKNNELLSTFSINPVTINKPSVTYLEVADTNKQAAVKFKDSVLSQYQKSKNFNPLQPGPLYQVLYHSLPGQRVYKLQFNYKPSACVSNWEAVVHYNGDVMAMYKNNKIVYDQFNYNGTCKIRLNELSINSTQNNILLQLLPLPEKTDIYFPSSMLKKNPKLFTEALLRKIDVYPVYHYTIRLN